MLIETHTHAHSHTCTPNATVLYLFVAFCNVICWTDLIRLAFSQPATKLAKQWECITQNTKQCQVVYSLIFILYDWYRMRLLPTSSYICIWWRLYSSQSHTFSPNDNYVASDKNLSRVSLVANSPILCHIMSYILVLFVFHLWFICGWKHLNDFECGLADFSAFLCKFANYFRWIAIKLCEITIIAMFVRPINERKHEHEYIKMAIMKRFARFRYWIRTFIPFGDIMRLASLTFSFSFAPPPRVCMCCRFFYYYYFLQRLNEPNKKYRQFVAH